MRRVLLSALTICLQAQDLPPGLELPPGLQLKPGSLQSIPFDRESFELQSPKGGPAVHLPVEGRTWRFLLRSSEGRPLGALTLAGRLRDGLGSAWVWEWKERLVARRLEGEKEWWFNASPGGSGELKVTVVEKGLPRTLDLKEPALLPELPKGTEDFPYLPPWPGSQLRASAVSRSPVDLKLPDGKEQIALVNWIDKEYQTSPPPSPHEFLVVYRAALLNSGWEIEGTLQGASTQIQAAYRRRGRDLRATLRLMGDALGISVADVGAQLRHPDAKPK